MEKSRWKRGVVLRTDQDVRRMGMEWKERGAESLKDRRLAFKGAMKLELRSKVEGGMRLSWEGDPWACRVWGFLEPAGVGKEAGEGATRLHPLVVAACRRATYAGGS